MAEPRQMLDSGVEHSVRMGQADLANAMVEEIHGVIEGYWGALTYATAIGVLEIVKADMLRFMQQDAAEQTEDDD